jgi:inosine-uridine nucleoside N-ribohydrolase
MKSLFAAGFCILFLSFSPRLVAQPSPQPVPLVFDTDIGNDCDDVLALGMIHALQSRGECQLMAVTITKDHELAAAFTDVVNTFYGRGNIPIGVCRSGITPEAGKFNKLAQLKDDGRQRYPHDLVSGRDAEDAVAVLRKTLVGAEDSSVVICQVGFSTNLANLIASKADGLSALSGTDLVKQKVKLLSMMAGAFAKIPNGRTGQPGRHREYNVVQDIPSAQRLVDLWPTPIVWSGFEIGLNLKYPHRSIQEDYNYVRHHPLAEAYTLYMPPPHDRPTWDLTSVLYAVRPDRGYFDLSSAGQVQVDEEGYTTHRQTAAGRDRYLIIDDQHKPRILEALQLLSSQPPDALP